jgi:hypothetical protein
LAKDNFVLSHRNLIPGVINLLKQQQDAEIMMGHNKEVEEWLMGSGESAETAASQGLKGTVSFKLVKQPESKEKEDTTEDHPEEETWMFQTFSKNKKKELAESKLALATQQPDENLDTFSGMDDFLMSKRIEPKDEATPTMLKETTQGATNSYASHPNGMHSTMNIVQNDDDEEEEGVIDMQLDQFINHMDSLAFENQFSQPI